MNSWLNTSLEHSSDLATSASAPAPTRSCRNPVSIPSGRRAGAGFRCSGRAGRLAVLALALGAGGIQSLRADDWPQWRGPARDGISQERGLLQEWPKEGPKLLWRVGHAGSGYSTPAVVGERIYLLGNEGLEDESVRALAVGDGRSL